MAPRNTHPHVPPTSLLPGTQRDPPRSSLLGAPTCLYGDGTRFPGYPPPPSPSAAGTRSWSRWSSPSGRCLRCGTDTAVLSTDDVHYLDLDLSELDVLPGLFAAVISS